MRRCAHEPCCGRSCLSSATFSSRWSADSGTPDCGQATPRRSLPSSRAGHPSSSCAGDGVRILRTEPGKAGRCRFSGTSQQRPAPGTMGSTTPSQGGLLHPDSRRLARAPCGLAARCRPARVRPEDRGAHDPSGRRRALKVLDFVSEQAGIVTICTYRTPLGPGSAASERGSEFHTCVALCPRPRRELAIPISWGETTLSDATLLACASSCLARVCNLCTVALRRGRPLRQGTFSFVRSPQPTTLAPASRHRPHRRGVRTSKRAPMQSQAPHSNAHASPWA